MPRFGPFQRKERPGVPSDHFTPWRNRFVAVDHRGRVTALVADGAPDTGALAITAGPSTTSDEPWTASANEKNLGNGEATADEYQQAYGWVERNADIDVTSAYAFLHHFVSAAGQVGPASTQACTEGIGVLNGGRGSNQDAGWWSERQGIYSHLAGHLKANGMNHEDLPELDDLSVARARGNWVDWCVEREMRLFGHSEAEASDIAWRIATGNGGPSITELLDQFAAPAVSAEGEPPEPQPEPGHTTKVTPVRSGEDLAAKIADLRARQIERPEGRTSVVVAAATESTEALTIDLAVRWDPELEVVDPNAFDAESGTSGVTTKGGFVDTLGSDPFAMVAAGADVPQIVDNPGGSWHAILCVEGLRTDEDPGREIMAGACCFPDLPVSLRLQIRDEGGHYGAVTCGRIDTMERVEMDGYNAIAATGVFGTDEHGQAAQLLVEEQTQRFISIDPRNCDMEIVEIQVSTSGGVGIGYHDDDDDEDCDIYEWWVRYTNLTIGAATIVATPALQQAVIAPADMPLPETPIAVQSAPPSSVILASGEAALPVAADFANPGFHVGDPRLVRQVDGHYACPLTVEGNRVYGHIAYWGANHTGFPGRSRKPPHSPTYAYFMTGARLTAEGTKVPVGNLTMGCGHASTSIRSADQAKAHYASVAHYDGGYGAIQMADVAAGEDDFGIWVSGVLCDDVTPEQVARFESLGLSGDWREIAGKLHLVAALAVPVPGFPIAREDALVASAEIIELNAVRAGLDAHGGVYSLVAAGRVRRQSAEERLAVLEHDRDELMSDLRARRAAELKVGLAALVNV